MLPLLLVLFSYPVPWEVIPVSSRNTCQCFLTSKPSVVVVPRIGEGYKGPRLSSTSRSWILLLLLLYIKGQIFCFESWLKVISYLLVILYYLFAWISTQEFESFLERTQSTLVLWVNTRLSWAKLLLSNIEAILSPIPDPLFFIHILTRIEIKKKKETSYSWKQGYPEPSVVSSQNNPDGYPEPLLSS